MIQHITALGFLIALAVAGVVGALQLEHRYAMEDRV